MQFGESNFNRSNYELRVIIFSPQTKELGRAGIHINAAYFVAYQKTKLTLDV